MIQAKNNFVFIIRDEAKTESSGFIIPGQGQEKPSYGQVFSVGGLVQDKSIKKGQRALFHKGIGFSIEYEGVDYLVIEGEKVIGTE